MRRVFADRGGVSRKAEGDCGLFRSLGNCGRPERRSGTSESLEPRLDFEAGLVLVVAGLLLFDLSLEVTAHSLGPACDAWNRMIVKRCDRTDVSLEVGGQRTHPAKRVEIGTCSFQNVLLIAELVEQAPEKWM